MNNKRQIQSFLKFTPNTLTLIQPDTPDHVIYLITAFYTSIIEDHTL